MLHNLRFFLFKLFHAVDKDVTLHSDFKHNQIHEGRRKGTKGKI